MDLKQANVLITGGSEGIGLGLAIRFLAAGSRVIITGRNVDKLNKAEEKFPALEIFINDIGKAEKREALAIHIIQTMPEINILINNAGIQRRVALADDNAPWQDRQEEINILLSAPVHLNHLLVPLILKQPKQGIIVNVTSGGAYIPQVFAPVYSACKAALHSYTITLRQSLTGTNCRTVELIPPAVQTGLAGPGLNHGASMDEFCDAVFDKLTITEEEQIGFGPTKGLVQQINGRPLEEIFEAGLSRFPVNTYAKKV